MSSGYSDKSLLETVRLAFVEGRIRMHHHLAVERKDRGFTLEHLGRAISHPKAMVSGKPARGRDGKCVFAEFWGYLGDYQIRIILIVPDDPRRPILAFNAYSVGAGIRNGGLPPGY